MSRVTVPLIAAFLGLSGTLLTTLYLYHSGTTALDRVLDERLRGAGASAAECFATSPPDAVRLKSLMDADSLEGVFLMDRSLRVIADATGPSGQRVDLLRIDPERVARAFSGEGNTAPVYDLGDLKVAAAYFPVRDQSGSVSAVLALEAGQAFTNARKSLQRALAMGIALSIVTAAALAALAAGWGRAERQRRLAAEQAARGETMQKMAAIAAHEIRNPLGVIRGTIELMRERATASLSARDHEALSDVLGEVERLRRLTEDFLDLSAEVPLQHVDVDLQSLLNESIRAAEAAFPEIRIVASIGELPPVAGDPVRLRQVVDNLLVNAAEAQETGQVDIGARVQGDTLSILVRDRGPGIPPELRDRIFDPLVTSKTRGTGLGLALSRKIAERHGGKLKLLETSPKGSTFEIRLPVRSMVESEGESSGAYSGRG